MIKSLTFMLLALVLHPLHAVADAQTQLRDFIGQTQTLSAQFSQTVTDRTGRRIQDSTGTLYLARPGRFRWVYEKPYAQLIVGDGKKLWIYDEELEQVTVRKLDRAIGESPAALLAGSNDIEKLFVLKDGGRRDGLDWLEATPKSREGNFEQVRMGFKGIEIKAMEVKDNFGQTTRLRFTDVKRNPALPAKLFRFTPPKGVDVIGGD
jgi:outer membrane lipoprotein carrier protein